MMPRPAASHGHDDPPPPQQHPTPPLDPLRSTTVSTSIAWHHLEQEKEPKESSQLLQLSTGTASPEGHFHQDLGHKHDPTPGKPLLVVTDQMENLSLRSEELNSEQKTETCGSNTPSSSAHHALHDTWAWWYDHPKNAPSSSSSSSPVGSADATIQAWQQTLLRMGSCRTVERFWTVMMGQIKPPSHLSLQSNLSLFRQGLEPTWEHPGNTGGGKWVLSLPKMNKKLKQLAQQQPPPPSSNPPEGQPASTAHLNTTTTTTTTSWLTLDEAWYRTCLALIGEMLEDDDDDTSSETAVVVGVVVSVRKQEDRLALWCRPPPQMGSLVEERAWRNCLLRIGQRWKNLLQPPESPRPGGLPREPLPVLKYSTHQDAAATGHSFRTETRLKL